MAKKQKKEMGEPPAEPPMSSMIDVVFLLLIYFVATAKDDIPEAHMAVNLPAPPVATAQPPQEEPPKLIEIKVLSQYYEFMGRQNVALSEIRRHLNDFGATDGNYTVIIKTSIGSKNQRMIDILDACSAAGLKQLNLVTVYY
ncbi:MAG: ExbD/TolR family protein [Lentisphaeria bacterium]